jgi:hypothetical protein
MLKNFMRSPEWEWLKTCLEASKNNWMSVMMTTPPVGEKAALVAQAQGAMIAVTQMLGLPALSLKGYEDIANDTESP